MPLPAVLEALGLPPDASDSAIARRMRSLGDLTGEGGDPALWVHLLDAFTREIKLRSHQQATDMGALAFYITLMCMPDDDDKWTEARWAREIGLTISTPRVRHPMDSNAGHWVNRYVSERLGPVLHRAGLIRPSGPARFLGLPRD